MKYRKILLIGCVTNELEDTKKSIVHYANIGDILIVHAVRDYILSKYPLYSVDILSNKDVIDKAMIERINKEYSLLVLAGGGYIHHCPMTKSKFLLNGDIKVLDGLKIPMVINSIGYNVNHGQADLPQEALDNLKYFIEKAELVSARDFQTVSYLHKITDKEVFYNIDPVYTYVKKFYGCTQTQDYILIAMIPALKKQFEEIIKANPNEQFVIIHHTPTEELGETLRARYKNVINTKYNLNINDFLMNYSRCSMVIGAQYHSLVIGKAMNKKVLNFNYNHKNSAFYNICYMNQNGIIELDNFHNIELILKRFKLVKDELGTYATLRTNDGYKNKFNELLERL